MKQNRNAEPSVPNDPRLQEIPVLRAQTRIGRAACSQEFVKEGIRAKAVSGNFLDHRFIQMVLFENGRQFEDPKPGKFQPLSSCATFSSTVILLRISRTRSGIAAFGSL